MQQPVTSEKGDRVLRPGMASLNKQLTRPLVFRTFLTILKVVAGFTLLVLSIQGIRWADLAVGIKTANLFWLLVAITTVITGLFLKLWRWSILVKNYQVRASKTKLFSAYIVGQAVNIILPFRGGDLVRIGFFANDPIVLPEIASTIVLEKYMDLLALTICTLWISFKISIDNVLNVRGWLLPLTVSITLVVAGAILFGPAAWKKIRTDRRTPKRIVDWVDKWVQTSRWLRNPRQIMPPILLTTAIWGLMWLTNLILFKSLGIELASTAGGLVLVLVYVGLSPALMPGNIGPFYFFARLALLPFGVYQDQAIVYAIVLHAIVTLPALIGGLIGLVVRNRKVAA